MIWKFDNFPLKLAFCGCYCRVYVGYTGAGNFCSVIKLRMLRLILKFGSKLIINLELLFET